MSTFQLKLPLFPLNLVLFPGTILPLHIFEERYKSMVQQCLEHDSQFGVVLIKVGSDVGEPADPYSIGTIARILQVKHIQNGHLLISVVGEKRFLVNEIIRTRPYIEGQVEILKDDADVGTTREEVESVQRAANRNLSLILGFRGGWVRKAKIPDDPSNLSYFVPSLLQSDIYEKQSLLEEPSTKTRLLKELQILENDNEFLREQMVRRLLLRVRRQ